MLSLYAQPLVAFKYVNVNAAVFVETVRLEAAPKILDPFLSIVKLFEARLFPLSIIVTSSPTLGEAGKVTVTGEPIPYPEVSTNN